MRKKRANADHARIASCVDVWRNENIEKKLHLAQSNGCCVTDRHTDYGTYLEYALFRSDEQRVWMRVMIKRLRYRSTKYVYYPITLLDTTLISKTPMKYDDIVLNNRIQWRR